MSDPTARLGHDVCFCRRVSPLGRFRASDDVADPLYGSIEDDGQEAVAALSDTVAHLMHACGGLLDYLLQLQRRSVTSRRSALCCCWCIKCCMDPNRVIRATVSQPCVSQSVPVSVTRVQQVCYGRAGA